MNKRELRHLEIMVIVHGLSEKTLVEYIQSNLRLKLNIISENGGRNSIQITSIMNILNNTRFKNKVSFLRYYNQNGEIKIKNKRLQDFTLFIIMDTDDCSQEKIEDFKNKKMFENHWLYEYIVPIFNVKELEDVLKKSGIVYEIKSLGGKGNYIKVFPVNKGGKDIEEIIKFKEKLNKAKDITNMNLLIDKCIQVSKKYE